MFSDGLKLCHFGKSLKLETKYEWMRLNFSMGNVKYYVFIVSQMS